MSSFRPIRNPESHAGTYGWIGLAAGVAAFDYLSPETLSHAVDRALERPVGKYLAIGSMAIVGAHLLNLLPEKIDPFVGFGIEPKS